MAQPEPVPAASLGPGDFRQGIAPDDLVYFLLNVGDGDSQLLLLPQVGGEPRRAVVVDIAPGNKLGWLVEALADEGLLGPPNGKSAFPVVVATHPHADHIGGMGPFLNRFSGLIGEFWEPGYYHPAPAYLEMMRHLEDHDILHTQPTSGTTRFIGQVRLTTLSPSIALKNRFDSYGVNINDASLALKVEFPVSRVEERDGERRYIKNARRQTLILGADSQTLSWAQVLSDFPTLHADGSAAAKAIGKARGAQPLRADVFKVSHHGSKHGVNLELIELMSPKLTLISSVATRGKYNFPHTIAQELIREGLQALASKGGTRAADHELGLLYTADQTPTPAGLEALGTIAVVMSPNGRKRQVWRFGDERSDRLQLSAGRMQTV